MKAKSQMMRVSLLSRPGSWTRHQYRQVHLALSTLAWILMLSAALSRWGGAMADGRGPIPASEYETPDLKMVDHVFKM